jgi:hypothetical protein
MAGFILRLLLVVPLLAYYLIAGVLVTVYAGIGWLFTGRAWVRLNWPPIP